jgi:hypothetical protein
MTRVEKLIEYLYDVIGEIINNDDYQIKVDFLEDDINSYSIDKIPLERIEERWIFGGKLCQDTYTFRSRFLYSSTQADELENIGFWETFEKKIEEKNQARELPDIEGIEKIECLNCGSVATADDNTCEMNIQIKITYREGI